MPTNIIICCSNTIIIGVGNMDMLVCENRIIWYSFQFSLDEPVFIIQWKSVRPES